MNIQNCKFDNLIKGCLQPVNTSCDKILKPLPNLASNGLKMGQNAVSLHNLIDYLYELLDLNEEKLEQIPLSISINNKTFTTHMDCIIWNELTSSLENIYEKIF